MLARPDGEENRPSDGKPAVLAELLAMLLLAGRDALGRNMIRILRVPAAMIATGQNPRESVAT